MKSIEFTEEDLSDLNEIGKRLFCDEQDPRSAAYVRKLVRPSVNWVRMCLSMFIPILLLAVLAVVLNYLGVPGAVRGIVEGMFLLVYVLFSMKRIVFLL